MAINKPEEIKYFTNLYNIDSNIENFNELFNEGNETQVCFAKADDYIKFETRHKINLWRYLNSTSYNGKLKLLSLKNGEENDVSSEYLKQPDATGHFKFIESLPIGTYKLVFDGSARYDVRWFIEKIPTEKILIKTEDGSIQKFNDNNRWETLKVSEEIVDKEYVLKNGFDYDILRKSYNKYFIDSIQVDTVEETGEKIYLTDEILTTPKIIDLDLNDDGETPVVEVTIDPTIPKDSLGEHSIIYQNSDPDAVPLFDKLDYSSTETHNKNIDIKFNVLYNNDEKIRFRVKVNDTPFTTWSLPTTLRELSTSISFKFLKVGMNDLIIEVSNEDGTKVTTNKYKDAIELKNEAPLAIIKDDSNNFRLHFIVNDADVGDKIEYRLLLSNGNVDELVLMPWSVSAISPIEIDYSIDTTNVEIDKTNIITIEYKDEFGTKRTTKYTFTGEYRNIMFADENNYYYTTDKGSILKILKLGSIQAGTISDAKPVKLVNKYGRPIHNLKINVLKLTQEEKNKEVKFQISKSKNPFVPLEELDYGDEIIHADSSKTFYVRAISNINNEGVVNFEIDAKAHND